MNWYKLSQSLVDFPVLYRGTPKPDPNPQPRFSSATFFTTNPQKALGYGEVVSMYKPIRSIKILNSNSMSAKKILQEFADIYEKHPETTKIVGKENEFFNYDTFSDVPEGIFLYPTPAWVDFLKSRKIEATQNEDNICLIFPSLVKYIGVWKK